MITYYPLGADKKLNEIVVAGSHDAGITGGGSNVKTQAMDIGKQAAAGVRVFDLRIVAATHPGGKGANKEASLVAVHAAPMLMKHEQKTRFVPELLRKEDVVRTKLKGGAFGEGLSKMLLQAKAFVQTNGTEFLILKFDKSTNWELIAESCVAELGGTLYSGGGNLNTTSLKDLKGKVICLFTEGGISAISQKFRNAGIMGVKNLYSGGSYDPKYPGMQYYGKGGTSVKKFFGKIAQNQKKQGRLMKYAAAGDPDVMGMMYWTTTGIKESIETRNEEMWQPKNVNRMQALWKAGLAEAIEDRIANHIDPLSYSSAPVLKTYMPNIVMIDFADETKCQEIFNLTSVAATELTAAARQVDADVKRAKEGYGKLQKAGRG